MAFTYGFYNSKGGDRKYNADQMGNLFDGILNDGVFDNVGNIFATVPGEGLQVLVKSGRAWFNKTWSYNDAAYPIYLERPDVAVPRIDAIVLEVDRRETHRRNRIGYIVGIPDSTPKKPTLTNTDLIHQHPLAYVTVRAGTESILHSDIEIRVGQSDCPFVTGILQTANIDDLFAAWNEQFTTWFEGVKSQLEGDVAANLLREIQLRLPIADKATSSEVGAGTVDNKYITPKQLAPHLGKVKDSTTGALVSLTGTPGTAEIVSRTDHYNMDMSYVFYSLNANEFYYSFQFTRSTNDKLIFKYKEHYKNITEDVSLRECNMHPTDISFSSSDSISVYGLHSLHGSTRVVELNTRDALLAIMYSGYMFVLYGSIYVTALGKTKRFYGQFPDFTPYVMCDDNGYIYAYFKDSGGEDLVLYTYVNRSSIVKRDIPFVKVPSRPSFNGVIGISDDKKLVCIRITGKSCVLVYIDVKTGNYQEAHMSTGRKELNSISFLFYDNSDKVSYFVVKYTDNTSRLVWMDVNTGETNFSEDWGTISSPTFEYMGTTNTQHIVLCKKSGSSTVLYKIQRGKPSNISTLTIVANITGNYSEGVMYPGLSGSYSANNRFILGYNNAVLDLNTGKLVSLPGQISNSFSGKILGRQAKLETVGKSTNYIINVPIIATFS